MQRQRGNLVSAMIALSVATTSPVAFACTRVAINEVINGPKDFMRKSCLSAQNRPKRFLANIRQGKMTAERVLQYAQAFGGGRWGCDNDQRFAFDILDAHVGSAINAATDPFILSLMQAHAPEGLAPEKQRQIDSFVWLRGDPYFGVPPSGWSTEELGAFVQKPAHWDIAIQNFGKNLLRDEIVFDALTDTASLRFDRQKAASLAALSEQRSIGFTRKIRSEQRSIGLMRKITAAGLMLDRRFGEPDHAAAANLLSWYSPYIDDGLDAAQFEAAQAIRAKLIEYRLGSNDPAVRAGAQFMAQTGAVLGEPEWVKNIADRITPDMLMLSEWPKSLPPMRPAEKMFVEHDYPARAFRQEIAGPVGIAAHFRPDGSFAELLVAQSSGSQLLDSETVKIYNRRFRPRFTNMKLTGHPGRNVLVPLPVVEWRIATVDAKSTAGLRLSNGRVIVVAGPIIDSSGGYC